MAPAFSQARFSRLGIELRTLEQRSSEIGLGVQLLSKRVVALLHIEGQLCLMPNTLAESTRTGAVPRSPPTDLRREPADPIDDSHDPFDDS